jgi:hypothetical protein
MDLLTNTADAEQEWVRGFLLRLGYLLAAEYQTMPAGDFRDLVGNYSNDMIELAESAEPEPEPPVPLRAVS